MKIIDSNRVLDGEFRRFNELLFLINELQLVKGSNKEKVQRTCPFQRMVVYCKTRNYHKKFCLTNLINLFPANRVCRDRIRSSKTLVVKK